MISIEVAYATPEKQLISALDVEPGTTAKLAVEQSGLLHEFPEISMDHLEMGVFSRPIALDYIVKAGDRLEIYRPLLIDPKEKRRQRAK